MVVKDTQLGGSEDLQDFDPVVPLDLNDTFKAAVNLTSVAFVQNLNLILDGVTTTSQDNLKHETFGGDNATAAAFMEYDAGNDWYAAIDMTDRYWVIIEATSLTEGQFDDDGCDIYQIGTGKWLLVGPSGGTYAESRGAVFETLFYDNDASGGGHIVTAATGVTAIKTPDTDDVGRRAHMVYYDRTTGSSTEVKYIGTYTNTVDNEISYWYRLRADSGSIFVYWDSPDETERERADDGEDKITIGGTSEDYSNHADFSLGVACFTSSRNADGRLLILCNSDITYNTPSDGTFANIDYQTDHSIPDLTLATEDPLEPFFITQSTTITANDNFAILTGEYSLAASNTISFEISFDGNNYQTVNEKEFTKIIDTGTSFFIKTTITRQNADEQSTVSQLAAYWFAQ